MPFMFGVDVPMYPPMYPGPYPGAMENPHNKALFDGMYQVRVRMQRAIDRCNDIEMSEHTMGFLASAEEYNQLAQELRVAKPWIEEYMKEFLEIK